MNALWIIGGVVGGLIVLFLVLAIGTYFSLWFRAFVTRARVGLPTLVMMSLRKVNPRVIVECKIMAVQAGISEISNQELEAHYLSGGNVRRTVQAMIIAHRADIPLDWNTAAAIDLAGRDILEAVRMSVDPKVIDCPDPRVPPGRITLDAIAKNGIQLKVQARVTVRANLEQLVGGAAEETVIARVGEGIVSAIGSSETHADVLANPMVIARRVLERGLDSQTAFEIVSIDIANIDVGENVGARLQVDQAEADVRVARAHAEERRAAAVAVEQEMVAKTVENRALVVLAESEIPKAAADSFRIGNLGGKKRRQKQNGAS
ncbi:MAG: flotillin-like protein FloA [Planctomycetaceae bacterium]|nr:flotillin-like protein FloA [Planctomycetaceae bacterium]